MADSQPLRILGIAGSLRRGALNRGLIRAAAELAPPGVEIQTFDLAPIPLYDGDVEARGFPESVQALRESIRSSDAVLIATPEYNYSIPGVLKNAIDWASRPPDQPFADKPVALMGASPGGGGTTRAQHHLRQAFVFLDPRLLNRPELLIARAGERFDADGNLTDERTREHLRALLVALVAWVRRLSGVPAPESR